MKGKSEIRISITNPDFDYSQAFHNILYPSLFQNSGLRHEGINNERIKSIRKIKKRIFAIPMALAAIPVKPKTAAMIAMTKKITAHDNIMDHLL